MNLILNKYAKLLINYCVSLKPGERLYIRTTTAAEPLVKEIYREGLKAGGIVDVEMSFEDKNYIFLKEANGKQLEHISPGLEKALEEYEAYIFIKAPHNLKADANTDSQKAAVSQKAFSRLNQIYFERTANLSLKRSLCLFPTVASAQNAGMSLDEYTQFVFNACHLYADDPIDQWNQVREKQQRIVDKLNSCTQIQYINDHSKIQFATTGRKWINSDGRTNMPSGEVYTSPVEDSVSGTIHFDYPCVYKGQEVENVTLEVDEGYIQSWHADKGKEILDEVFAIKGTRRFGEAAIGTNYNIQQMTKNILFDEKIGGTIHMAIGQSYKQAGGKNESIVHWDMIADMTKSGVILADDEKIYEKGKFIF